MNRRMGGLAPSLLILSCYWCFNFYAMGDEGEPRLSPSEEIRLPQTHVPIEVIPFTDGSRDCARITFENGHNLSTLQPIDTGFTTVTSPGWLAIIDADAGGTGNFANEPSPSTIAFWLGSPAAARDLDFSQAVSAVSFEYTSFVTTTLTAFDADGNVVASASGAANFNTGPGGDPTGSFNLFSPLGVDVGQNIITRVTVSGNVNQTGIDDLVLCQEAGVEPTTLIIEVDQYESYLPEDDNFTIITATTVDDEGSIVVSPSSPSLTLTLVGTTNFRGVCNNAGSQTTNDYGFGTPGQQQIILFDNDNDGIYVALLESFDFGGATAIQAAISIDGEPLPVEYPQVDWIADPTMQPIPKDTDDDGLPDSWEDIYGNLQPDEDIDTGPVAANQYPADGLANFDEYRGFFVGGIFSRTDPTQKDLFVHSPIGIGYLLSMGIDIHQIAATEMTSDRIINANRVYNRLPFPFNLIFPNTGAQQGVEVVEDITRTGSNPDGRWTLGNAGNVGTPSTIPVGFPQVYTARIQNYLIALYGTLQNIPAGLLQDKTSQTIAHEIGHCTFLCHLPAGSQCVMAQSIVLERDPVSGAIIINNGNGIPNTFCSQSLENVRIEGNYSADCAF